MRVIAKEQYVQLYISKLVTQLRGYLKPRENHAFIGIYSRGATLCNRIIQELNLKEPRVGFLDINFYRDDFSLRAPNPVIKASHIPFSVEGLTLFLIDDVIYTGRTVLAALRELFDFGRPARVVLITLVNRAGRELPIQPDITALELNVARDEEIVVSLKPDDREDKIYVRHVDRKAN